MGATVQELINEINQARTASKKEGSVIYETKSQKDEVTIMKAMLNDTSYQVSVYGPNGNVESTYCPAAEIRKVFCDVLQNTTGLSVEEAQHNMDSYEFKNKDAQGLIGFSKEFVNTYLQTGRKLPLGARERSNVSLIRKTHPGGLMLYPSKVNKNDDDTSYESIEIQVDEYDTIKCIGPCPDWRKHRQEK